MLKIENAEVLGWEHVIRGMRNPKNSWGKSDSFNCAENGTVDRCFICPQRGVCKIYDADDYFIIGPNDHKLMMSLAAGGPVHAKYRRMITVYLDITAPLYWWKEFDTYKIGTVANSCSTMHKIHAKEFTLEDFSLEHVCPECQAAFEVSVLHWLNTARGGYLKIKDKAFWWHMIQLLPSSYNQKRTIMLNYEVLHNIYHSRRHHKLDEWHVFCDWIEGLPYSELITGKFAEPENP